MPSGRSKPVPLGLAAVFVPKASDVLAEKLRELILSRASESALMAAARANNMSTLREQCLVQVREGLTTLEEVVRVTQ